MLSLFGRIIIQLLYVANAANGDITLEYVTLRAPIARNVADPTPRKLTLNPVKMMHRRNALTVQGRMRPRRGTASGTRPARTTQQCDISRDSDKSGCNIHKPLENLTEPHGRPTVWRPHSHTLNVELNSQRHHSCRKPQLPSCRLRIGLHKHTTSTHLNIADAQKQQFYLTLPIRTTLMIQANTPVPPGVMLASPNTAYTRKTTLPYSTKFPPPSWWRSC